MNLKKLYPIYNKIRVLDDVEFVNTYIMNIPTLKLVVDFNGIRFKFVVSTNNKEPYFNFLNDVKDLYEKYSNKMTNEENTTNFENEINQISDKYTDQIYIFNTSTEPAPVHKEKENKNG